MASFAYKGRNAGGQLVQGTAEAVSPNALADQLFVTGVTPLEIAPSRAAGQDLGRLLAGLGKDRVKPLDVMLFSRQLYTLCL